MPKGFYRLISAQFFSGLGDNALMILGIFFLREQGYPGWWSPLLKFSFTLAYVLLAPLMGPLADAFAKPRLMALMNGLKIAGLLLLVSGMHPLLCFALMGMAAAAYAPAKYGLVTESVPPSLLIRANAWLEVSVVMSVILGAALGGLLIQLSLRWPILDSLSWGMWTSIRNAFLGVLCVYLIASVLNVGLPLGRFERPREAITRSAISWRSFWVYQRILWRDPLGQISLFVTTLYWGVGATLPFLVLLWADQALGLPIQQAAYLQALVAVGVIFGALAAARLYRLHTARKAIQMGWLLVVLLPLIAWVDTLCLGLPMLLLAGAAGGLLLVPMNGLLQYRGFKLLSAGRSIAVQGFNENLSVLIMLGAYSAMLAVDWPLWVIMTLFSLVMAAGTGFVCLNMHQNVQRRQR